ncbi:hypothetical protein HELRODRAFT_179258 [Helobdella robusta]|uniref:Methyltransferase FkbM domain-containing protein n=1 Tax=Helobdella robusta TaxID=6412 RepID=T1FEG0_HELRO|nr:hypothetical protein HELRODRAFT_179258 [Helobdella robusta]ESN95488.1 hypothetical protein HELRODRAFT_179258 [Helobdella robusta]
MCAYLSPFTTMGSGSYFTLLAAKQGHWVVAVDPVWGNLRRLNKALRINGLNESVLMLHNAVGPSSGLFTLRNDESNLLESECVGECSFPAKTITMNDLGHLLANHFQKLSANHKVFYEKKISSPQFLDVLRKQKVVLKIDVNCFEHGIFLHADNFFDLHNVIFVIMDWPVKFGIFKFLEMFDSNNKRVKLVLKFFRDRNYDAYSIKDYQLDFLKWKNWPLKIVWSHRSHSKFLTGKIFPDLLKNNFLNILHQS